MSCEIRLCFNREHVDCSLKKVDSKNFPIGCNSGFLKNNFLTKPKMRNFRTLHVWELCNADLLGTSTFRKRSKTAYRYQEQRFPSKNFGFFGCSYGMELTAQTKSIVEALVRKQNFYAIFSFSYTIISCHSTEKYNLACLLVDEAFIRFRSQNTTTALNGICNFQTIHLLH